MQLMAAAYYPRKVGLGAPVANFIAETPAQLGNLLRAARKANRIRLEDLAQLAGVSKQTVQDIEHGKPTAQLGKVLLLLRSLGVRVNLTVAPEQAAQVADVVARLGNEST